MGAELVVVDLAVTAVHTKILVFMKLQKRRARGPQDAYYFEDLIKLNQ